MHRHVLKRVLEVGEDVNVQRGVGVLGVYGESNVDGVNAGRAGARVVLQLSNGDVDEADLVIGKSTPLSITLLTVFKHGLSD